MSHAGINVLLYCFHVKNMLWTIYVKDSILFHTAIQSKGASA